MHKTAAILNRFPDCGLATSSGLPVTRRASDGRRPALRELCQNIFKFITDPSTSVGLVVLILAVIGLLDVVEMFFRKFVTWTHKVRLHWRRLWSEPDPKVLLD